MKAINTARLSLIKKMLGQVASVLFYGLVSLIVLPRFLEYGPKAWSWMIIIGALLIIGQLYNLYQEIRKFKSFVSKYTKIAEEIATRKITKEQKKCYKRQTIVKPQLPVLLGEIKNALNDGVDLNFINELLWANTFHCWVTFTQQPTDMEVAGDDMTDDISKAFSRLSLFNKEGENLANIELI